MLFDDYEIKIVHKINNESIENISIFIFNKLTFKYYEDKLFLYDISNNFYSLSHLYVFLVDCISNKYNAYKCNIITNIDDATRITLLCDHDNTIFKREIIETINKPNQLLLIKINELEHQLKLLKKENNNKN